MLYSFRQRTDVLAKTANLTLSRLEIWSQENSIEININKTKAVFFEQNKLVGITRNITVNSTPIEILSHFRVQGMFFVNMSQDNHVNYIINKLSQIAGLIFCQRLILPMNVKFRIYNSLIYSRLNYCHLFWGSTTSSNSEKIYILQKRLLRSIGDFPLDSHPGGLFKAV